LPVLKTENLVLQEIGEHSKDLTLGLRMHRTGFYPGIYDFPYNLDEVLRAGDFRSNSEDLSALKTVHSLGEIFERTPIERNEQIPIQGN